jgi:hypothetical protein
MSIITFITSISKQTAVYWGSPTKDGRGGATFASPEEIACRWEDKTQVVVGKDGKEITVDVIVMTNETLVNGGFLYLGELADLDSAPVPLEVSGAYEILSVRKVPLIKSSTKFVKTYYLNKNHRSVREV